MINKFGQDIKGYPFDKAQSFASEERRTLNSLFGDVSGIVTGIGDQEGALTTVGLQATIGTVTIAAKGSWYRTDTPIKVTLPPSVSGYILARVDLSEENTSTGSASDGTYNYALNQVKFFVTTESPVKENLLLAGNVYDVIIAKFTSSTTDAVVTDAREYAGKQLTTTKGMVLLGSADIAATRNNINSGGEYEINSFDDSVGASYIPTRYLKNIYRGQWKGSAAGIYIDNGGIDANNNLGSSLFVTASGNGRISQTSGTNTNENGSITSRRWAKDANGSWGSGSITQYTSNFGSIAGIYSGGTLRRTSFIVPPGTAAFLYYSCSVGAASSSKMFRMNVLSVVDVYLADGATGGQILTSTGQQGGV